MIGDLPSLLDGRPFDRAARLFLQAALPQAVRDFEDAEVIQHASRCALFARVAARWRSLLMAVSPAQFRSGLGATWQRQRHIIEQHTRGVRRLEGPTDAGTAIPHPRTTAAGLRNTAGYPFVGRGCSFGASCVCYPQVWRLELSQTHVVGGRNPAQGEARVQDHPGDALVLCAACRIFRADIRCAADFVLLLGLCRWSTWIH